MKAQRQKFIAGFEVPGTDELNEVVVWFDQRDLTALERNRGKSLSSLPEMEALRWVVWHAGRRAKVDGWPQTIEDFERTCAAVEPAGVETVDPGQPGAEADSSPS